MKRVLSLVLVMTMLFSLSACGGEKDVKEKENGVSSAAKASSGEGKEETQSKPAAASQSQAASKPQGAAKPQQAHKHSYSQQVVPATCTEQGYTLHTCSCGDSYTDNYTSAAHIYSNYVCTNCNAIDKSNAFKYLCDWMLKNGQLEADHMQIKFDRQFGLFQLMYYPDAEGKPSIAFYDAEYVRDASKKYPPETSMIFINGDKKAVYINELRDDYYISGDIELKTFSANYPLLYDLSDVVLGQFSHSYDLVDYTRERLVNTFKRAEQILADLNTGITLKDLGFESFK